MSDWKFLNEHRVIAPVPLGVHPMYASTPDDGFNGMFRFPNGTEMIRCVASDGSETDDERFMWQHVSVSIERDDRPPRWAIMCRVKDLFWEPEDWVVQYHPARSQYVNHHPGCLHLWRPLLEKLPIPNAIMVGPKRQVDILA